jgi:hypothetical protein
MSCETRHRLKACLVYSTYLPRSPRGGYYTHFAGEKNQGSEGSGHLTKITQLGSSRDTSSRTTLVGPPLSHPLTLPLSKVPGEDKDTMSERGPGRQMERVKEGMKGEWRKLGTLALEAPPPLLWEGGAPMKGVMAMGGWGAPSLPREPLGLGPLTFSSRPLRREGHASLVRELKAALRTPPGAVVLSVGGGGLLAGVAAGLVEVGWQHVPIVAMETHGAHCFNAALQAGHLVTLPDITRWAWAGGHLGEGVGRWGSLS